MAQSNRAVGNSIKLASGVSGGASSGLLTSVAQGKDARQVLLSTLQGAAYGLASRLPGLKGPAPAKAENGEG